MASLRSRGIQLSILAALSLFLIILALQSSSLQEQVLKTTIPKPATHSTAPSTIAVPLPVPESVSTPPSASITGSPSAPPPAPEYNPPHPIYKPTPSAKQLPPVIDNFPLAAAAHSASELPPVPSWNQPPNPHVPENTPLFIGFTRNWRVLQQAVVSYIAAGWPAEDIFVVENTGVMDSNKHGRLSLQNPFFLNHTRLDLLGVNVLITPTLFTFAQLQNFYLWTAIQRGWESYFWGHMDIVVLGYEGGPEVVTNASSHSTTPDAYRSLYAHAVETLRETDTTDWSPGPEQEWDNSHGPPENWAPSIQQPPLPEQLTSKRWAARFFHYDHLALVQTKAFEEVGGWDTSIPFYMTDCDMHERLFMRGFRITDAKAGHIFDVGTSFDDIEVLYRKKSADGNMRNATFININKLLESDDDGELQALNSHVPDSVPTRGDRVWEEDGFNSSSFDNLLAVAKQMQTAKATGKKGRNTWQTRQRGGEGDPYYRDAQGFEDSITMAIEHGRRVYREKWGHRDCDLINSGLHADDAWRVLHDWD
ncbi:hypothetical protein PVAG01_04742 [Phlyctema vagabunda]|uniref:Glycosyltransferase family 92 protein n=1 Tax=Phlyctema vagabunda TaxID=108571 RepID=A0ABR4PI73_9HELO